MVGGGYGVSRVTQRRLGHTSPVSLDPRDFGAVGDGRTDDTIAVQAAIDSLPPAGGEVVFDGTFVIDTYTRQAQGWSYGLKVARDNVTLRGVGRGSGLRTRITPPGSAPQLIAAMGAGKIGDIGDAATWYPQRPGTPITATAPKGATSIRVVSPVDFERGDLVFVKTGQTIERRNGLQPDAELNEVVNVTAHALELRYPLAKTYAQESYLFNGTELSSVGGSGAPTAFEVSKVTDCTIRTFAIRELRFDVPPKVTTWCQVSQAVGVELRGLTGRFGHSAVVTQYSRDVTVSRLRATKLGPTITGSMVAGAATGSTNVLIEDLVVGGRYPTMIHLHEGVAECMVRGVEMRTGGDPSLRSDGGVSIRARSYDTQVVDCHLVGGTGTGVLHVDPTCVEGGVISGNVLHAVSAATDALLMGAGWYVHGNVYAKSLVSDGRRNRVVNNRSLSPA